MAITTFSDAFGTNLSNSYRCAHAWMFEHALGVRLLNLNSRRSIRAHAPIFHAAVQCSILQKVAVSPTFRRTLLFENDGTPSLHARKVRCLMYIPIFVGFRRVAGKNIPIGLVPMRNSSPPRHDALMGRTNLDAQFIRKRQSWPIPAGLRQIRN